jgi:hypothetical protein
MLTQKFSFHGWEPILITNISFLILNVFQNSLNILLAMFLLLLSVYFDISLFPFLFFFFLFYFIIFHLFNKYRSITTTFIWLLFYSSSFYDRNKYFPNFKWNINLSYFWFVYLYSLFSSYYHYQDRVILISTVFKFCVWLVIDVKSFSTLF